MFALVALTALFVFSGLVLLTNINSNWRLMFFVCSVLLLAGGEGCLGSALEVGAV